jgi:thiol-disulfide isomerase/thioredoxin
VRRIQSVVRPGLAAPAAAVGALARSYRRARLIPRRDPRYGIGPMRRLTVSCLLSLSACGGVAMPEAPAPRPSAAHASEAAPPAPPRFVENDLDAALAEARAGSKLVLVDGWAPWCHTCLSMHHEVLTRPELGRLADRYVFASIDTDRPESTRFVERYAQKVWPTFFVIDPSDGAVLAMHGGGASLEQMLSFLEHASLRDESPGTAALRAAHASFAAREHAAAAKHYREAAALIGEGRRAEALLGAMRASLAAKEHEACVELGRAELRELAGGSLPGDFAYYLSRCAEGLEPGTARDETLALVEQRLRELVASPSRGASVDDRADVAAMLADALRKRGQADEARAVEELRLGWLEVAAREATSPEAAAVHDYARLNAYLALGRSSEAIAMLEERTRQLPDRYEPHARLAQALEASGSPERALASLDRAIALSYGPRKLGYLAKRVRIHQALLGAGTSIEARAKRIVEGLERALRDELAAWAALPEAQRDAARIAVVEAKLAEIEAER